MSHPTLGYMACLLQSDPDSNGYLDAVLDFLLEKLDQCQVEVGVAGPPSG